MIHRHSCWQMYIVDLTRVQSYSFQVPQHAATVELKRCRLNKTNQGEHAGPLYFQKEQNKLLYCLEWSSPTMSCWVVLVFGNVWLFKRGPCLFFLLLQIVLVFFNVTANICSFYWVVYSVGVFFLFVFWRAVWMNLHLCCDVRATNVKLFTSLSDYRVHWPVIFLFLFWICASVSIHAPVCQTSNCEFDTCFFFPPSPLNFKAQLHLSSVWSRLMICVNVVRVHIVFSLKKKDKKTPKEV